MSLTPCSTARFSRRWSRSSRLAALVVPMTDHRRMANGQRRSEAVETEGPTRHR